MSTLALRERLINEVAKAYRERDNKEENRGSGSRLVDRILAIPEIAATPDLLEAAKALQGSAADPRPGQTYTMAVSGEALLAIRAAIAKATGEVKP